MNAASLALDAIAIAMVGGVISLDRRSALQLMISQPLVAVPLLGALFGVGHELLWLGAITQLLFISSVLFGTTVPANETIVGLAATGGILFAQRLEPSLSGAEPLVWVPALLMGLAAGAAGRALEIKLDGHNRALSRRAEEAAARCDLRALAWIPWVGIFWLFSVNTLLLGLSALLIAATLVWMDPLYVESAELRYSITTLAYYVLPALGLGVTLTTLRTRAPLVLAAILSLALGALRGLSL